MTCTTVSLALTTEAIVFDQPWLAGLGLVLALYSAFLAFSQQH